MLPVNAIHSMDCIQGLDELDAGVIDLVFADPPFNIGYEYDTYDDNKGHQQYIDWSYQWMKGVHRALKPDGTFWLAIGDEYAAELKILAQSQCGFHCRSWVIWYYTFGVNCKAKFTRSHAHLLHFVKDRNRFTFNWNDRDLRVPSARQLVYGDKRANPDGRLPDDLWMLEPVAVPEQFAPKAVDLRRPLDPNIHRPQDIPSSFEAESDTWYNARVAGTFGERQGWHGCQMPEQILGRIVRFSSNERDLVLDPFTGSGTTLAVAKKLNRQYIGFEISDAYAQYSRQRLEQIAIGDKLAGPVDPLRSAPKSQKGRKPRVNPKRKKTGQD